METMTAPLSASTEAKGTEKRKPKHDWKGFLIRGAAVLAVSGLLGAAGDTIRDLHNDLDKFRAKTAATDSNLKKEISADQTEIVQNGLDIKFGKGILRVTGPDNNEALITDPAFRDYPPEAVEIVDGDSPAISVKPVLVTTVINPLMPNSGVVAESTTLPPGVPSYITNDAQLDLVETYYEGVDPVKDQTPQVAGS